MFRASPIGLNICCEFAEHCGLLFTITMSRPGDGPGGAAPVADPGDPDDEPPAKRRRKSITQKEASERLKPPKELLQQKSRGRPTKADAALRISWKCGRMNPLTSEGMLPAPTSPGGQEPWKCEWRPSAQVLGVFHFES
jgi:hypothetical protein